MRVLPFVLVVVALTPGHLGAQGETDACLAEARSRASAAVEGGASREAARSELEIAAASCFEPDLEPAAAHTIGSVQADRARLARDMLAGQLTLAAYRELLRDRREKLEWLLRKPQRQRALAAGDADGDLVADRRDRCPATPKSTPTGLRGCHRLVQPPSADERARQERDERALREILAEARFLYNRSCDGAPPPRVPSPLAWGRGSQTRLGGHGFNLAVSRVGGQAPGCEVFYEIQLRFSEPNPATPFLPLSKTFTLVFSESEDLVPAADWAIFPLPAGLPPSSPARAAVLEAMQREYLVATWRVRAVDGNNTSSPWSPFVTQRAQSGING